MKTEDKMMRLGYIRVSTNSQENSVLTQKEMINSYSKLHGIEIDDYFTDFGISGKSIIKREKYLTNGIGQRRKGQYHYHHFLEPLESQYFGFIKLY